MLFTFMMFFMVGNQLSVWTIVMIVGALWTPAKDLMNFRDKFAPYEGKNLELALPKLKYLGFLMLTLAGTFYKFNSMSLLPLSAADWMGLTHTIYIEETSAGVVL